MKKILAMKYYIFSCIILLLLLYPFYFMIFKKIDDNLFSSEVKFIGHVMYVIENIDYTNLLEVLKLGYDSDIRYMDVDFLFTSDEELVLNYYWKDGYVDTYNNFLNKKIKIKDTYTAMDIYVT